MELIANYILSAGVTILSFILLLLILAKKKEAPQILLITYFSFILMVVLHAFGQFHNLNSLYYLGFLFDSGARYFLGPLLYIYVKSLFEYQNGFIKKNLLHFLPFIVNLIFLSIPFMVTHGLGLEILPYLNFFEKAEYFALIEGIFFLAYIYLAIKYYSKATAVYKSSFSYYSTVDFKWVKKMLIAAFIVMTIDILTGISEYAIGNIPWDIAHITILSLPSAVLSIRYAVVIW